MPCLENYECECNPSNIKCNKAEEISIMQLNEEIASAHDADLNPNNKKGLINLDSNKNTDYNENRTSNSYLLNQNKITHQNVNLSFPNSGTSMNEPNQNQEDHNSLKYAINSSYFSNKSYFYADHRKNVQAVEKNDSKIKHNKKTNVDLARITKIDSTGKTNYQLQQKPSAKKLKLNDDKILQSYINEPGNDNNNEIKNELKNSDDTYQQKHNMRLHIQPHRGACFNGIDSYFHYSDAETMRRVISYKIDLNLRFKTYSNNGVILWSGRHSAQEDDDFLSLGIENG